MENKIDEDSSSSWESLDEEEDSCQKFLHNLLILEKVFSHLSLQDLKICRLVNHQWNKTSLTRNQLGSKSFIKITTDNFDNFLQTAQNASLPFCRQFNFHMIELDPSKIIAFKKVFKQGLSNLSIKFCSSLSVQPIIKLFNCPNLRELKISGDLFHPLMENQPLFRRKENMERLTHLELSSSIDYGQVSQAVIHTLLQHSPNLHSICIGRSDSLWRSFLEVANTLPNSKLQNIKLCNMESPVSNEQFIRILPKLHQIKTFTFDDCIVRLDFLQGFLDTVKNSLEELNVQGTQSEILSKVFLDMRLPQLTQLTLPIDGISIHDGCSIIRSLPKLRTLKVLGLFQTTFTFRDGKLFSLFAEEFDKTTLFSRNRFGMAIINEKRREFLKVLRLLPLSPKRIEVNLPNLNSQCLRNIYQAHPDIEELIVQNNSRECLDAWTGIPIKVCRKISACKTFSLLNAERVQRLPSVASLKNLKRLEISILDEPPKAEFTIIYILYGICQLRTLKDLSLTNMTMSDIAFLALSKRLNLKVCHINHSDELWNKFNSDCKNVAIKSFLLPPEWNKTKVKSSPFDNSKILKKVLSYLPRNEIFRTRLVSKNWHSTVLEQLHKNCHLSTHDSALQLENYLDHSNKSKDKSQSSPNKTPRKVLSNQPSACLAQALRILKEKDSVSKLILRGMNKSMLEFYQRENNYGYSHFEGPCKDRRKITYWFYPDGTDDLIISGNGDGKSNPLPSSITVIGSWTRKDSGLLEFINPSFSSINSIGLSGLLQEVYDLVLPRLTTMQNIESVTIMPFSSSSVSEISRNHLQILANSSFSLRNLSMQKLQVPPDILADLIKSHRFTLETVEIQNHVNVSDRLSFAIPHLKKLQLDEPPGIFLWTTLNINQNVESIHFERSGYIYNQVKSKALPKLESVDGDFEHSATEVLCDINLFLESVSNKRPGVQKSVLQEGSDSALRFLSHFRFLTSLTLRTVHAHYGILNGIFKNLTLLEKLVFTNTAGITDEIITGFPKNTLDKMDLLNPLQFRKTQDDLRLETSYPSIRNLKKLVHLNLDDQTMCTDFSVIFGIMKLKCLKYFSCKRWKITDVSVRAIADMTVIETLIIDGSSNVSSFGVEYFNEKSLQRLRR